MATEIKWLGHSTFLIQSCGQEILIDPYVSNNPVSPIKNEALNPDLILVTHGHEDHTADLLEIAKRSEAHVVANFEICAWLERQGYTNSQAMNLGGTLVMPIGTVKMVYARHSSSMPDGAYGGLAAGFVITFPEGRVYFAGDTDLFLEMKLIGMEKLDCAFLPIGDVYTMGIEASVDAVKFLQPKKVIPVHYNTWEIIAQESQQWAKKVEMHTGAEPVLLAPGETIRLEK